MFQCAGSKILGAGAQERKIGPFGSLEANTSSPAAAPDRLRRITASNFARAGVVEDTSRGNGPFWHQVVFSGAVKQCCIGLCRAIF